MSIFPVIKTIDDLYPKVKHFEEIRFKEAENGYTIAHYMIGNNELFSGETAPYTKECRGITFCPKGYIASRSVHKFFNVGERLDTQDEFLNWDTVSSIQDKRDGSCINPVPLRGGKIIFKSKKSFTSDVANIVNLLYVEGTNEYELSRDLLNFGYSPTFEYTSPTNRIVLNYKEDKLVLLHVRDTATGEYYSRDKIKTLGALYNVAVVDEHPLEKAKELKEKLKTDKDFEGYIFQFGNGEMVKMKSTWYLELHRTVVFLRKKDITNAVLNETVDDLKSFFVETQNFESLTKIEQIELEVTKAFTDISNKVENILIEDSYLDRKTFAIKHQKNNMFGLLMAGYMNKPLKIKDYLEKFHLELFSLEQI